MNGAIEDSSQNEIDPKKEGIEAAKRKRAKQRAKVLVYEMSPIPEFPKYSLEIT